MRSVGGGFSFLNVLNGRLYITKELAGENDLVQEAQGRGRRYHVEVQMVDEAVRPVEPYLGVLNDHGLASSVGQNLQPDGLHSSNHGNVRDSQCRYFDVVTLGHNQKVMFGSWPVVAKHGVFLVRVQQLCT